MARLEQEPAFPLEETRLDNYGFTYSQANYGMSKRFYAAVQIATKIAYIPEVKSDPAYIAEIAFKIADELLIQEQI